MTGSRFNRREFLASMAAAAAGMGLGPTLLGSVQRAFAIEPAAGSTFWDAKHVVFLMQENRSFDHAFGSLQGVRGFNDPRAISLPGGLPVWFQATQQGDVYSPFRLDLKQSRATWMGDLPHNWPDQVDARNQGKYDRWLPAKTRRNQPPMTLGFHIREDIPFYYALADAFTICDQHFCSSLTGTTPNRLHFWTGTIREKASPESRPHVYNSDTDHIGRLRWTTFPERLTKLAIPWKVYQNELTVDSGLNDEEDAWLGNFGDNPLEYFAQYHARYVASHYRHLQRLVAELPPAIERQAAIVASEQDAKQREKFSEKLAQMRRQLEQARQDLVTWHPDGFAKLDEAQQRLHHQALCTNHLRADYRQLGRHEVMGSDGSVLSFVLPKGDILHQFREDVATAKLPTVSWLVAPKNFSDHPSAPWFGAWYVSEALNILSSNPELWKKTIFVLTYDENDGFFDHCPPFVAPRMGHPATGACSPGVDSSLEFTTRDRVSPIGLGYRVPLIIASPWTRGGWVNSQVCDLTSPIRFLERFLSRKCKVDLHEPNITSWRRTVSGDLTSCFRPWRGEALATPAFLDQRTWMTTINQARGKALPDPGQPLTPPEIAAAIAQPAAHPRLPRQEPGTRPACALPYDLMVDGALTAERTALQIDFSVLTRIFGAETAGCPFQVYAPGRVVAAAEPAGAAPQEPQWEDVRTWNYAVAAGGSLAARWPLADFADQRYHLRVHGANGFFRELRGDRDDPPVQMLADTQVDAAGMPTGDLRLVFSLNRAAEPVRIQIRSHGHALPAITHLVAGGEPTTLSLPQGTSHGWYDVTLTADGFPLYSRRYAGRCETGRPSRTDPVMGRELPA